MWPDNFELDEFETPVFCINRLLWGFRDNQNLKFGWIFGKTFKLKVVVSTVLYPVCYLCAEMSFPEYSSLFPIPIVPSCVCVNLRSWFESGSVEVFAVAVEEVQVGSQFQPMARQVSIQLKQQPGHGFTIFHHYQYSLQEILLTLGLLTLSYVCPMHVMNCSFFICSEKKFS